MITEVSNDFLNTEGRNQVLEDVVPDLETHDRDRYLIAMMADGDSRVAMMVLFAMNLDLARIPEKVSETVLGQMRYQSWRDALLRARADEKATIPLAGLVHEMAFDERLVDELIDARESVMLIDGPPGSLADVRRRAEQTGGTLAELALRILSQSTEVSEDLIAAARHAGTAYTMIGIARAARTDHMPPGSGNADSICDLCMIALEEIRSCRTRIALSRPSAHLYPAFAPATFAEEQAETLARFEYDPSDPRTHYRGVGATLRLAWRRWRNTP